MWIRQCGRVLQITGVVNKTDTWWFDIENPSIPFLWAHSAAVSAEIPRPPLSPSTSCSSPGGSQGVPRPANEVFTSVSWVFPSGTCPEGLSKEEIQTRCHLNWFLSMWSRNGSTLSSDRVTEHHTLSLRKPPCRGGVSKSRFQGSCPFSTNLPLKIRID